MLTGHMAITDVRNETKQKSNKIHFKLVVIKHCISHELNQVIWLIPFCSEEAAGTSQLVIMNETSLTLYNIASIMD